MSKKRTSVDAAIRRARIAVSSGDEAPDMQQLAQNLLMNSLPLHNALANQLQPEGYKGFIQLLHPEPSVLISNINAPAGPQGGNPITPFIEFGGHPVLATSRTPEIRIIKVYKDANDKAVDEVEIPLFLYGTQKIVDRQDRSNEAFFKGINFDLKDQTAFGASRMVQATLSLGFNSFRALNRKYRTFTTEGKPGDFSYLDLIRRTNGRTSAKPTLYHSYSLRLEIGWNPVSAAQLGSATDDAELAASFGAASAAGAEFNKIVLLLELEDYDLNITQNGMITLDLNYHSYMDRELTKRLTYDVFSSSTDQTIVGKARDKKLKEELDEAEARAMAQLEELEARVKQREEIVKHMENSLEQMKHHPERAIGKIVKEGGFLGIGEVTLEDAIKQVEEELADQEYYLTADPPEPKEDDSWFGFGEDPPKATLAADRRVIENARDQAIARLTRRNKINQYATMLTSIVNNGRVYQFIVDQDDLLLYSPKFDALVSEQFEGKTPEEVKREVQKRKSFAATGASSAIFREQGEGKGVGSLSNTGFQKTIFKKVKELSNKNKSEEDPALIGKNQVDLNLAIALGLNELLDASDNVDSQASRGKQVIYYVYLGDIIEAAIGESVFETLVNNKTGLMIGNLNYSKGIDPYNNLETSLKGSSESHSINIANIPINLEYFSQFFAKTITNKNVTKLPLLDFVNGIVKQLVIPSLNQPNGGIPVSSPTKIKNGFVHTSNAVLTTLGSGGLEDEFGAVGVESLQGQFDISNKDIMDEFRKLLDANTLKQARAKDIWTYMVVYGTQTKDITGLTSRYESDMAKGIYHFTFGDASSRSALTGGRTDLIKDIKFVKMKKAGQREMMVERQLAGGTGDQNLELWNVFNVEMTMVGNNLLAPGKHIYIEPVISGFSYLPDERGVLNELGLGGYYLVTAVSNEIDNGNWTTSVSADWQSNGITNISPTSNMPISAEKAEKIQEGTE